MSSAGWNSGEMNSNTLEQVSVSLRRVAGSLALELILLVISY
jgi:hypothetical protein